MISADDFRKKIKRLVLFYLWPFGLRFGQYQPLLRALWSLLVRKDYFLGHQLQSKELYVQLHNRN